MGTDNPRCYAEGEDGVDAGAMDDGGTDPGDGADTGEDPMVAKVLSSKTFQDMQSKIDEMYNAIMGGGQQDPGAGGMDPGMGGGGMDPGMGGAAGGMGGEMPQSREAMGQQPVRFDGMDGGDMDPMRHSMSGFAGPTSTHIPGTTGKRYQRPQQTQQRQPQRRQAVASPEVVRLSRQVENLTRQLQATTQVAQTNAQEAARIKAEKIVYSLEREGIVFGGTPQEHDAGVAEAVDLFAMLDPKAADVEIAKIRRCYARRESDPANPVTPGVARYARADTGQPGGAQTEEDYEPRTPQEAKAFAELQCGPKKLDYAAAAKEMVRMQRSRSNGSTNGRQRPRY